MKGRCIIWEWSFGVWIRFEGNDKGSSSINIQQHPNPHNNWDFRERKGIPKLDILLPSKLSSIWEHIPFFDTLCSHHICTQKIRSKSLYLFANCYHRLSREIILAEALICWGETYPIRSWCLYWINCGRDFIIHPFWSQSLLTMEWPIKII